MWGFSLIRPPNQQMFEWTQNTPDTSSTILLKGQSKVTLKLNKYDS